MATSQAPTGVQVGLNAVVVAVTDNVPRLLVVEEALSALSAPSKPGALRDALPFGMLNPDEDPTLELALRRYVTSKTGLALAHVEQLYTFGARPRRNPELHETVRLVSIAYLALVREQTPPRGGASWRNFYDFFPWEDWREGRPKILDSEMQAVDRWLKAAPSKQASQARRGRAELAFGLAGVGWDEERVLDRYELLYEMGLVEEAARDARAGIRVHKIAEEKAEEQKERFGRPMVLDHRRILASALGRLRGKLKYRPHVFEMLPPTFTLLQLQRLVESLAGRTVHKQNFRRLVRQGGLVEGTGELEHATGGRPAELYAFRSEVLRERPAPGVGRRM